MATFFFDNDISFRIANAIKCLVQGHEIIALRERFRIDAHDVDWIPEAGRHGWVVISRDFNQRRGDAEREAMRAHKVRALYIRQSGRPQTLYADAARIVANWPKIEAWGSAARPGELARLDTSNRVIQL